MARYLLNKNTGAAHDLNNEKDACKINEIKSEHRYTSDSLAIIRIHTNYKEDCDYCLNKDG